MVLIPRVAADHGTGYVVVGLDFSADDRHLATVVHRMSGTGATLFLWDLAGEAPFSLGRAI